MKKRILSCLMALALCLTLLPTAALAEETEGTAQTSPAMEEAADPANGEAKQENQPAAPEQEGQSAEAKQESQSAEAKQENQPAEQEEQQEDSAAKQAVAAVQAMIDALPDAADLDGMDDAEAMEVYEAFQTACEAYYDTLSEKQREQLKNTEKLEALSERFSQLETLAAGTLAAQHFLCGGTVCNEKGHKKEETEITFNKWLASTASTGYTLVVGQGDETGGTGQKPVNGKYVLSGGNYYLKTGVDGFEANVKVEHPIQIKGNVTICLNGQTIESNAKDQPVFEVVSGTLTLTDCQSNKGKVTHFSDGTGSGVEVNGGKFNLYGGSITKNTADNGGGVYVYNSGEFNMYGGSITLNTAASGGVKVDGGKFNLYGGEIADNKAEGQNSLGGGVYVVNGTFTMSGGTISGNTANSTNGADGGVGVYNAATFNMSGGEITGNTASSFSGGVGVHNLATFIMSGGTIGGTNSGDANNAKYGGGVNVGNNGKFNMSGGKISGNKATENGGGVYMDGTTFTVSGAAVIKDNKKGTAANNVYLRGNKYITIDGTLDGGASIGVTTEKEPAAGGSVIAIGKDLTAGDAEKFKSDLGGYAVSVNESKNGLLLVKTHRHCLCGKADCNGRDDHLKQETDFTPWTDALAKAQNGIDKTASNSLPSKEGGKYYLDTDVTLTETWTPASGTVLCLNGHNITMNGSKKAAIYVINAFTLCDCKGGKDAYGQITHATGKTGSGVYVSGNGRFYMYGGSISNNTTNLGDNGGGVYMAGGQFTMYGGSITKNTAKKDSQNNGGNGGGVYVNSGTFDMNGNASVSDNTATKNGGGVYVGGGTFTMNDTASVKDNTASDNTADQGNGGGVYVYSGTFEMNGSASVSSNKATNSKSENTTYGGGVYVNDGTFTMNGNASVSGNKATNGGGVYASVVGKFNMNGNASITGNTANGVFVNGGTFTVSGEPTVTGNTGKSGREDDVSNVYLAGGDTITIGGKLDAGASIGVTKGAGGVNSVIATGAKEDYSGKFFVDDNKYKVGYDETHKQLVLAEKDTTAETHTHCLCGKTHTAIGDHKTEQEVTFATELKQVNGQLTMGSQPWSAKSITINGSTPNCYVLPAGSYYLGSDLALDASIYISENVQLCLNGNSIISNGDNVGRDVVIVDTDSSDVFTLANCRNGGSITHATGKNGCGVYMNGNRTKFNMYGGIITGNNSGGVNVTQTNTFNMYGGSITNNSNGYGGGVYNGGTVNIYGGEISDNTASNKGGGVYMAASMGNYQGGILNVSGAAKITDNKVNGVANNVYLPANKTITIGEGGLSGQIGVTTEPKPAAGTPVTVIASIGSNTGLATHVVSDDNAYATAVKGSTIVLKVKGDGGTPTEKPYPDYARPTAKIGLVYNGRAQALISESHVVVGGMMKYRLDNGAYSPALPTATNAGTYTVYFMVKGDADHSDVPEQSITVTIAKAPLSGTPAYTLITSTGKTLADANLTAGDIKPENGQIKWVDENGVELAVSTEVKANTAYRWKFTPDDTSNYEELTGSITLYPVSTGGGGSSGGGGGSSSDRDNSDSNPIIKTETKNNSDGSTTKTETRRDGSVTQTTTGKDGSVSKTETKKDGSSVTENKAADGSTGTVKTDKNGQTTAETKVSAKAVEDAKKNGEAVKAPVEVEASRNSGTAPTVKVELPKGAGETKVEIPVSNVKPGTVAVLVHPDGTEEIVKNSIPTEDGIQLTVDGNATVKIVDNSKGFIDTRNHWAEDAIDFVSARGLVNGMSATIYAPNNSTTRAQLWTILARQNDADLSGGSIWYEKAQNWAKDKGVSDGANPNAAINRAQMVTMLWRAVGQPAPATAATFTDVSADAYYAGAVSWAVENGITTGVGGGRFNPTGTCTRAQIAAFLARSMK